MAAAACWAVPDNSIVGRAYALPASVTPQSAIREFVGHDTAPRTGEPTLRSRGSSGVPAAERWHVTVDEAPPLQDPSERPLTTPLVLLRAPAVILSQPSRQNRSHDVSALSKPSVIYQIGNLEVRCRRSWSGCRRPDACDQMHR